MAHDDEHTPAETPLARASSISFTTAALVLEELALVLSIPALSPSRLNEEQMEKAVGIILEFGRRSVARSRTPERTETDRLRRENRQLSDQLFRLRAMKRTDP